MSDFRASEGGVPQGWTWERLISRISLPSGQVDPRLPHFQYLPLIAPDHIESCTGRLLKLETAYQQGAISGKYSFQPGDVLYSKIRPYLRKSVLATQHGLCSADMYPLRPVKDLDPHFLLAVILGETFSRFATSVSERSGIPKLNREELAEFGMAFPPLPEQRKIARILTTVDRLIEKTEALIAKYQAIKQGMMHDLFTRGVDEHGQLRPPYSEAPELYQASELGWIPKGWGVQEIRDIAELITSGSRGWAAYYADSGAIFVRIGNLTREHINFRWDDIQRVQPPLSGEGSRTQLQANDVLVSITADLGIIGVIPATLEAAYINQHIALVRLRSGSSDAKWVGRYLASSSGQSQFVRLNDGGAKAGLNLPTIGSIRILSPPIDEQRRITQIIDRAESLVESERTALGKLLSQKSGLMQDLLTGRVRVKPDAEDFQAT